MVHKWHAPQFSELSKKQLSKDSEKVEDKRKFMGVVTGLNVTKFDSEADYMPVLPPEENLNPDYTLGVTQIAKTDREDEKFGDIINSYL